MATKRQQTAAKRDREQAVRERRAKKQLKKQQVASERAGAAEPQAPPVAAEPEGEAAPAVDAQTLAHLRAITTSGVSLGDLQTRLAGGVSDEVLEAAEQEGLIRVFGRPATDPSALRLRLTSAGVRALS